MPDRRVNSLHKNPHHSVLSISGEDPTELTGLHVDLETLKNFNVTAYSIMTALIKQNERGMLIEPVASEQVFTQCDNLHQTFKPNAIKVGMLGELSNYEKIADFLKNYLGYVVLDLISTESMTTSQYRESLLKLFPYADLVLSNRREAEKILNHTLNSYEDMEEGAAALVTLGAKSILMKGSDVEDALFSQDYWTNGHESFWLVNQRSPNTNCPGKGCMLSSAIAACLALGYPIKDAMVIAKMYVTRGIRKARKVNQSTVKLFYGSWPEDDIDLPYLSSKPLLKHPEPFKHCKLGLYPVVDSSRWVEKLLLQGVKCIQLRIKDSQPAHLETEIKRSIFLAKKYGATLFINDYWELAIRLGAAGVHLGQEDLHEADIDKIRQSGLYLGLSTYCYYEVATAHAFNPSYIACGPIYSTTSKIIACEPQGIEQLQRWRRTLHYPLVAIGGIDFERLPEICKCGVEGISLISAITKATDPYTTTQKFLIRIKELKEK